MENDDFMWLYNLPSDKAPYVSGDRSYSLVMNFMRAKRTESENGFISFFAFHALGLQAIK